MLEKKHLCRIGLNREIRLDVIFFFSSKGRICKNNIISILFFKISNIIYKSIFLINIRIFNTMENHIHYSHNISNRRLFISPQGLMIEPSELFSSTNLRSEILIGFYQKTTRTCCTIIDCFSNLWIKTLYHRFNHRSWSIVFSTISSIIPHPLQEVFINFREFK